MAAMGYTEWLLFASKWQHTVKKWFWEKTICTEFKECKIDFINNQNVQMFATWLPFYNVVNIDTDK